MTHLKLTFTRDGEKDIPVIRGSSFNVVVTNTEKIRIQKETIRKSDLKGLFSDQLADKAKQEVANLRLQAIASLPHLGVFSDEAHHTYGQSRSSGSNSIRVKTVLSGQRYRMTASLLPWRHRPYRHATQLAFSLCANRCL